MIKNSKDVLGEIDNSEAILKNVRQYTPYGKTVDYAHSSTLKLGTHKPPSLLANPYGYSGYYTDAESGLCYLNARYYSPELMRFISRDSYALPNRYAYADGNPIMKTDPSGHSPLSFMNDRWWGQWLISMIPLVGPALMAIDGGLSRNYGEMTLGISGGATDIIGGSISGIIGYKLAKSVNTNNDLIKSIQVVSKQLEENKREKQRINMIITTYEKNNITPAERVKKVYKQIHNPTNIQAKIIEQPHSGCMICLKDFNENDKLLYHKNSNEKHSFHKDCLLERFRLLTHDDGWKCPSCSEYYITAGWQESTYESPQQQKEFMKLILQEQQKLQNLKKKSCVFKKAIYD